MNRKDKSENGDQNIQNSCSQEIISTRELLETQVSSATFHPILLIPYCVGNSVRTKNSAFS